MRFLLETLVEITILYVYGQPVEIRINLVTLAGIKKFYKH